VSAAPLLVEVADGVARLTLNRPEVRNALDAAL
jgi:enoyl-CoA hydratase/carnithine racemase